MPANPQKDPGKRVLWEPPIRAEIDRAVKDLKIKTVALEKVIHYSKTNWSLDQSAGTIEFSRPGSPTVTAPVQIIGTYNTDDRTWLWGWDHTSIEPPLREHANIVLEYGRKHDVPSLKMRTFTCDETDCWEFTALACMLAGAQGAYRAPSGPALAFVTFGSLSIHQP